MLKPDSSGSEILQGSLGWTNSGDYWLPTITVPTTSGTPTPVNSLWFAWGSSDSVVDQSNHGLAPAYGGSLGQVIVKEATASVTLATSDTKGIKMGESGTGTLLVDFAQNQNRTLTLDLSSVTTTHPAFVGNIDIFSDNSENTLNIKTNNDGSIKGNLQFESGSNGNKATVNFKNKTTLEGRIGGVITNGKAVEGIVNFEQGGTIDGTNAQNGDAIYLYRTGSGVGYTKVKQTITFKQEGAIKGNIKTLGWSTVNTQNNITFENKGTIEGNITASGGINEITFKNEATITGQISATIKIKALPLERDRNTNKISFHNGGKIELKNSSNGKVLNADLGTNTITFYAHQKTLEKDAEADAKISGLIWAGGHDYPLNQNEGGTNNIEFKNANTSQSLETNNTGNTIKAELGDMTAEGSGNRKGANKITSTVETLDLTIGNIKSQSRGTTLIEAKGSNNTLKTGELYANGGDQTETKLQIYLHKTSATNGQTANSKTTNGDATNNVTIQKIKNYKTTDVALDGKANTATIGSIENSSGTTHVVLYSNTGSESTNTLTNSGGINNTGGTTNIYLHDAGNKGTHTLTTGDVFVEGNGSQVNIKFGESPGSLQNSRNTGDFILSQSLSSDSSLPLSSNEATNTATLENITNTHSAQTTISMKGNSNTLNVKGNIKTLGGNETKVDITLQGKGSGSSTNEATIKGIDSEKQTNITLGNGSDTSATNTLKLGNSLTQGGGSVNIKFGKGTNTLQTLDSDTTKELADTLVFTNNDRGTHNISFTGNAGNSTLNTESTTLTIKNNILSKGTANNDGTRFYFENSNQTIELTSNTGRTGTPLTLTTTAASQIIFKGDQGNFKGNITTLKAEGGNASGGSLRVFGNGSNGRSSTVKTNTITGTVTASAGGTNSFEYQADYNTLKVVGDILADGANATNRVLAYQNNNNGARTVGFAATSFEAKNGGTNRFEIGNGSKLYLQGNGTSGVEKSSTNGIITLKADTTGTNQVLFKGTTGTLIVTKETVTNMNGNGNALSSDTQGKLGTLQTTSGNTSFILEANNTTANLYVESITTGTSTQKLDTQAQATTNFDFRGGTQRTSQDNANQTLKLQGSIKTEANGITNFNFGSSGSFAITGIDNPSGSSQQRTTPAKLDNAGITNFNFAGGSTTLTLGTSASTTHLLASDARAGGNITLTGSGTYAFNLHDTTLTLKGDFTASDNKTVENKGIKAKISSHGNDTLTQSLITSETGNTTLELTGENATLTLQGGIYTGTYPKELSTHSSAVSSIASPKTETTPMTSVIFTGPNQTLKLYGTKEGESARTNGTPAKTLYTLSNLDTQGHNVTIDLLGDVRTDTARQTTRTDFRLLTIGFKDVGTSSGETIDSKSGAGFKGNGSTFKFLVNQDAGKGDSSTVTLGGEPVNNNNKEQALSFVQASHSSTPQATSLASAQNSSTSQSSSTSQASPTLSSSSSNGGRLGHAYSDRVIVGVVGDGNTTYSAQVNVFPQVHTLQGISYKGGGTDTQGNIALLTVKNGSDGKALIDLTSESVIVGDEVVEAELVKEKTDVYGKIQSSGTNGYTTYFLGKAVTKGVSEGIQEISATALSLNYDLFMANFNSVNKRLGELRNNPYDHGVWARVFGGMLTSNYGVKNNIDYVTVQAGYDYGFDLDGEARNYLGLALSYASSKSKSEKFTQNISTTEGNSYSVGLNGTQSQGIEVALYNSYVSNVGWYSDTIFKFSYIMSDFVIHSSNSTHNSSSQANNLGFLLSEEVGYRFKLGKKKEWFIDPQLELGFGYLSESSFSRDTQSTATGSYTTTTSMNALLNLRTRVGSAFGYEVQSTHTQASIYLGAFYEFDYLTGGDAKILSGSGVYNQLNPLSSSGRAVLNIGSNISLQDHTRLYFDVEKSFGDKLKTHLQFNAGVRYSFGNKNTKHNKQQEQSILLSAPLKVK